MNVFEEENGEGEQRWFPYFVSVIKGSEAGDTDNYRE
jgi:hypothetical protein